jgi:hypothetical protein
VTTPKEGPASGGNVFTRKLGPLPMWGWMGILLLVAILYYMWHKNQANASGNTSGASSSPSTVNTPGGVDSSLVPQFVNQVYNQETPPPAPNVTVNNTQTVGGSTPAPPSKTPGPGPLNEILQQGHTISPNPKKAQIGWTIKQQSPNATQLKVILNGPGAKNQTRYIPASATTATFEDLQAGHTYVASVTPIDAQGQAVGGPNNITFVTAGGKKASAPAKAKAASNTGGSGEAED